MIEITSYSASSWENGKQEFFVGEGTKDGQKLRLAIRCPNGCDPIKLTHKNWYESKELGTDLFIKCEQCGKEVNSDCSKDMQEWIKEI